MKELKFTVATKGRRPEVDQVYHVESNVNPQAQKGHLVVTGHIDAKQREFVFYNVSQNTRDYIAVPDELAEKYNDLRTDFMTDKRRLADGTKVPYFPNDGKLTPGEPIFYLERAQRQLFWLGRARIFRLPFSHTTGEFVPNFPEDQISMPDYMLGFTDQKLPGRQQQSYQGRISFSAGTLKAGETARFLVDEGSVLEPSILSGPKPTTFQHYLVQSVQNKGKADRRASYNNQPCHGSFLRGRKRYWHRLFNTRGGDNASFYGAEKTADADLDTQYTHIRPLRSGHRFAFDVRFDNLSGWELGLLTLALQLNFIAKKNEKTRYAHKIGMGKPLGLGSVDVKIGQISLCNRQQRYANPIGQSQDEILQNNDLQIRLASWQADFYRFVLDKIASRNQPQFQPAADATLQALADLYEERLAMIAEFRKMCDYGNAPGTNLTEYQGLPEFKDRHILPSPLDM